MGLACSESAQGMLTMPLPTSGNIQALLVVIDR